MEYFIKRILGLDTGTNSLGWAVVDKYSNNTYKLVDKGSLIFQEGVKIEKGNESSRAAERREHRALRRIYFRRRLRKIETLKVLIDNGLCPELTKEDLKEWNNHKIYPKSKAFLAWQRTNETENPYYCRYRCLTEKLDLEKEEDRFVLGRALYHLSQRRGFLSNRLDQNNDDNSGKVKEGIADLTKQMEEAGCTYLGEYFYKLHNEQGNTVRLRTRYTDRLAHYKKEFDAICEKQRLTDELKKALERAIYFQRPLKSQRHTVGFCTLEPKKKRCAESHPDYERFRMYSVLNNIKVKGPDDKGLRFLTEEERKKAISQFYRKSKANFDFEDIAKAIAGKGKYACIKDKNAGDKLYKFNYRMTQSVAGCPTITKLRNLLGDDYHEQLPTLYKDKNGKNRTSQDIENEIWNALSFFNDEEKLVQWGKDKLGLNDEKAQNFAEIKLSKGFASLSLKAIRAILPFLEMGVTYYFSALFAKVPALIGQKDKAFDIINGLETTGTKISYVQKILSADYGIDSSVINQHYSRAVIETERQTKDFGNIKINTAKKRISEWIPNIDSSTLFCLSYLYAKMPDIFGENLSTDDYQSIITTIDAKLDQLSKNIVPEQLHEALVKEHYIKEEDKLYEPSAIETYRDAKIDPRYNVLQLGSPKTNAVRNPMAMRSLHKVREVVNELLRQRIIDQNTEIHIEYARELNDSNKRQAIAEDQRNNKKLRDAAIEEIEKTKNAPATEDDITKYLLWEEQGHKCLYTGKEIAISDFLSANPTVDIEHTVPRSLGGDWTTENLTLCDSWYNREVKQNQLPKDCPNYDISCVIDGHELTPITERLKPWRERVEELTKQIDRIKPSTAPSKELKDKLIRKKHLLRMKRDYFRAKLERFDMIEVPEGFSQRQAAGIGLISKYAGLYLKSLFQADQRKNQFRVIKGALTAEFRKMWGIQNEFEAKKRDNHIHHCIDAITIACIGADEISKMGAYYHDKERNIRPTFEKPWKTFTEDIKNIENEVLVVHDTIDRVSQPKEESTVMVHVKKKLEEKVAQGDLARASLHQDTYYGAIQRDGKIKYVVRRPLDNDFKDTDIENIVDKAVRDKIIEAKAKANNQSLKNAIAQGIYMNEEKKIPIKKVRCYATKVTKPLHIRQQRDISTKEYKQQFHVMNDLNYCLAIYEGVVKNKVKREFELVNNLEATK
ncbi:MAG: HNH endonuclease domain-containing protein, partial [Bacteroidales bacterium]|nr:HNH endonuclease domain-containing protein [Bacteroidales bacterium]